MTATTEALIQAHTQHVLDQLTQPAVVQAEIQGGLDWLATQPLSAFIEADTLSRIIQKHLLERPVTDALRDEVVTVIHEVRKHPDNPSTSLGDLISDASVSELAEAIGKQKKPRDALIHSIFSNPTTAQMLSQTISHAVSDYLNNGMARKVPGVGGLMKLGKSVIEKATDSNLDDALEGYLSRNIGNIMATSEKKVINQLSDRKVTGAIEKGWQGIKGKPMSEWMNYVTDTMLEDGSHTVAATWDQLRQTPYLKAQIDAGVRGWYARNAERPVLDLLADLDINPQDITNEVTTLIQPIVDHVHQSSWLRERLEARLREFYASDAAQALLTTC